MKKRDILIIFLVTLTCWPIILPFVNSLKLPLDSTYGIISRVVIEGRNPLNNYAIYLILLLVPSLVILCSVFLTGRSKKLNFTFSKLNPLILNIVRSSRFLPIILSFAMFSVWQQVDGRELSEIAANFQTEGAMNGGASLDRVFVKE